MMYNFTEDWFSDNIPVWQKILGPLANNPLRCIEIGSFEGRSALWLHDNILLHEDSNLILVDPGYSNGTPILEQNLEICKLSGSNKICLYKKDSTSLKFFTDKYDFIYIDGSHSSCNVLRDAINSFDLLKNGGLLCFDDYLWPDVCKDGTSPKNAIDSFILCFQPYIEILEIGYQVWIRKI